MADTVLTSRLRMVLAALAIFTIPDRVAAQCSIESGARRVALLELYTSEGCDSCPPADRWISALAERGLDPLRVVTLGFHVDYWNYLGWSDPFAKAGYSERQRHASRRNQARVVYTPQLLLNGGDYRRGVLMDDIAERVDAINRDQPRARMSLRVYAEAQKVLSVRGTVVVTEAGERSDVRAYLALYENNLVNAVAAGENKGKRLRHDY